MLRDGMSIWITRVLHPLRQGYKTILERMSEVDVTFLDVYCVSCLPDNILSDHYCRRQNLSCGC